MGSHTQKRQSNAGSTHDWNVITEKHDSHCTRYDAFQRQSVLVYTYTRLLMAEYAKRQVGTVEAARVSRI